ncbi:MAG: SDR family oxidoreductase [Alphaproteobacteria bacterium]
MADLTGKAALVTGASRGIGAVTARELAARGASVLLVARSLSEMEGHAAAIRAAGGNARAMACDVASYASVAGAVEACVADFGRLDILVNNAAVIDPIARLADSDPDAWDRAIDINLKGIYHGLRAAIPAMLKGDGGVIVNISSGAATGVLEGWSQYCAAKHGTLALTRAVHVEYAGQGIRSVGLSPGTVRTEMQVKIKASGINPVSQLDPEAHIPPEWVASAIAWLCTDDAREFDGGDVALRDAAIRKRIGLS